MLAIFFLKSFIGLIHPAYLAHIFAKDNQQGILCKKDIKIIMQDLTPVTTGACLSYTGVTGDTFRAERGVSLYRKVLYLSNPPR